MRRLRHQPPPVSDVVAVKVRVDVGALGEAAVAHAAVVAEAEAVVIVVVITASSEDWDHRGHGGHGGHGADEGGTVTVDCENSLEAKFDADFIWE